MTAVVSSFVAILLVLLFLLSALLLRNKLKKQKKRPGNNGETLPFENQVEFGYMAPPPTGKWKISAPEYQEPFIPLNQSQMTSFPGGNQSGTPASVARGDKMAEYYSSSLVSTSTPPNATGESKEAYN